MKNEDKYTKKYLLMLIHDLREHLKEILQKHSCNDPINRSCHCELCTASHAVSYTSGFEPGFKPVSCNETTVEKKD